MVKNLSAMQGTQVQFLAWEDPLEKEMATPILLPGESQEQRSLAGYSPWGCKESDMIEHAHTMVCSLPGSSVCGILQARILEWVAMPSSRDSSQPRDWTHIA